MNQTIKRSLGAIFVLTSIIVAGLQVKGYIPAELAASIQALLGVFAYGSPSPVVRTGQAEGK